MRPKRREKIAGHIRRVQAAGRRDLRSFGAYGHPDHVAISQFSATAIVRAGDAHRVSKFYYFVNGERKWAAYQAAFKTLTSKVEGTCAPPSRGRTGRSRRRVDAREVWKQSGAPRNAIKRR